MNATTLTLFFIDGKSDGMLTAKVSGWTGRILVAPRTRLPEALKREESSYTGVYILLGEKKSDGKPCAYIGQGENIATRIRSHIREKDWWTNVVLITSAANEELHTAHVQYIEAKLVEKCKEAANTELENYTNPQPPSLTEAMQADMEKFIAQLLMVLPAIRIDIFTSKAKPNKPQATTKPHSDKDNPVFELNLKKENIIATAILEDGEFVVQKGSLAKVEYICKYNDNSYKKLYDELTKKRILIEKDGYKIFDQSYAFSSASAAGSVCKGRITNGLTAWKLKGTNKTYREWEAEKLAENQTTTPSQV